MTKFLSNSLGFIADIKVHISKNAFLIAASLNCNDEKSKLKSFLIFFIYAIIMLAQYLLRSKTVKIECKG